MVIGKRNGGLKKIDVSSSHWFPCCFAGKVLNVNSKPHHPECFTCCECNKSLVGVQFVEKEEQLYCADDYYNVFAPRCYNCHGMIKDKCVTTGMEDQRRTYHPQHFICTGCGTSLVAKNMQ
jgi:hypothetical protein